jgi:hypothetical protein
MATRSKVIKQVIQRPLTYPVALSGSTEILGAVVDRLGFASASIAAVIGTLTGSGTHSVVLKLYHNTANSTSGGVDTGITFTGGPMVNAVAIATATASLLPFNRYLYLGATPTFGGSETAALFAATIDLGDAENAEAVS